MRRVYPLAMALALLAGCGAKGSGGVASNADAATPGSGSVSGCGHAPSSNGPADDIVGIRTGTPAKEANALLACANKRYALGAPSPGLSGDTQFYADVPDPVRGPKQNRSLGAEVVLPLPPNTAEGFYPPSPDQVDIVLVGLPGSEIVAETHRTLRFQNGQEPPFDKTLQSLVKKYGAPTSQTTDGLNNVEMSWVYDPTNNPMSKDNPAYENCASNALNFRLDPGCGVTIVAKITQGTVGDTHVAGVIDVYAVDQSSADAVMKSEIAAINKANEAAHANAATPNL